MSQSRDELFLKLALRQGLFSQQEAREFLIRYRTEGARGEGVGHWLVVEGVIAEEQAEAIRAAIAHRAEGHVDSTRRRVPKRAGGGAQPTAGHGHHPVRHHRHPQGISVTSTQKALYISTGVVALGLLMFLVFQFQKPAVSLTDIANKDNQESEGKKDESVAEIADRLRGADVTTSSAQVSTPKWTKEEIESMSQRVRDGISRARAHQSDGRLGRAIDSIRKSLDDFGDVVPAEVQKLADDELAELQKVLDAAYAEALITLRKQQAEGDTEGAEETILEIGDICGDEYMEKARGGSKE